MTPAGPGLSREQRAAFLTLVDRQLGMRSSQYQADRVDEAIAHLLPRTTCAAPDELLEALSSGAHPDWFDVLVTHLTVGETYFLRDAAQVEALRRVVLPELIQRRSAERRLRLWSAGCSTGEEPYTLAILLREQAALDGWDVQLIGTDVNRHALRLAREATYTARSFRMTPDPLVRRHFERAEVGWRPSEAVRRMVRFAWLNLATEPLRPPSFDFDLIVCRNVTIYFEAEVAQRLYRALIGALAPGGWLILGPSDPLPAARDELRQVQLPNAVLWRRCERATSPPLPRDAVRGRGGWGPRRGMGAGAGPAAAVTAPSSAPASSATLDTTADLDAGLLALEAGSPGSALEWLRSATFRDPSNALAHFALAQAYQQTGQTAQAQAALLHARHLLDALSDHDRLLAAGDSMSVETLRQAVQTHLDHLYVSEGDPL